MLRILTWVLALAPRPASMQTPGSTGATRSRGSSPIHRIAHADLRGFSHAEASALRPIVDMILEALGPIFPPNHDDIQITSKSLPRDLARTVFYGNAADIDLNLDAHLDKDQKEPDAKTYAKVAQTLTHEIMLHTRKEFQEYFSAKRISRTGGGRERHRDACLPETRDEYFEANYWVSRKLTGVSRREFAQAWAEPRVCRSWRPDRPG